GLLVSHIDAFDDYQKNTAWIWEHQALVRSRFVAGDIALKGKFDLTRYQVLNQHKQQNELKSQIVKMRNKMMVELDKSKSDLIDLKQHRGGLIDIEFLTQYFCLFHLWKGDIPQNTIEGIIKAGKQQFIDEKEASILSRHYACYRDHLNQMVLQAENLLVPSDLFETELQQVTRIWDKYFTDEASE
ncbi:MAG: bifunctional glutamine synthetase adenylyltransferase/deadenyltransferase, partial [Gammaproteobacteria bacterium]|nr:bifunctional glutamine synthetase adenylyltransferase/deadenyltransferase [Gammaproteobacteria bacterium]